MKTDKRFLELNPDDYIDSLGNEYTRFGYLQDQVEEGFTVPEGMDWEERYSKMLNDDAHVEIELNGQSLFIESVETQVSTQGTKRVIIHAVK